MGDLDSADKMVSQAINTLADIDPLDPEYTSSRRTLALAYVIRANGKALRQEHDAAEQSFRRAINSLQSQSTSNPFFRDLRTEADVQRALADWHHVRGDFSSAKEAYYAVVQCFDQLLDQGRNRPDWLESRASAKLSYASCLKQLLNPTEAVAMYESAEEDVRRAWEIFSSESTHREEESSLYNGLGISLLLLGDSNRPSMFFNLA